MKKEFDQHSHATCPVCSFELLHLDPQTKRISYIYKGGEVDAETSERDNVQLPNIRVMCNSVHCYFLMNYAEYLDAVRDLQVVTWFVDSVGRVLLYKGVIVQDFHKHEPFYVITDESAQDEFFKARGYESKDGVYFMCDEHDTILNERNVYTLLQLYHATKEGSTSVHMDLQDMTELAELLSPVLSDLAVRIYKEGGAINATVLD